MTVQPGAAALFICPDYISHFYPLSAIALECQRRGMSVTFATGPGLKDRVASLGFDHAELMLGPGNNSGVLDHTKQVDVQSEHMNAFFAATEAGPIETLLYQCKAREYDMLWRPDGVYVRLKFLIGTLHPNYVIVDQLAFGATLALHALQTPFASFLPANPSSLPGESEVFGYPARLPTYLDSTDKRWSELRQICVDTDAHFTRRFNDALAQLAPEAPAVQSAFRFTSRWLTLLNYPFFLGQHRLGQIPPTARFIGSSVRAEPFDDQFESSAAALDPARSTVYVSLGTFLSAREDVMKSIAGAVRQVGAQCMIATGTARVWNESDPPDDWLAAPVLPQIAALRHCDLVISHGGNNTLTEALTQGVPLLVAPFSSDQFDNAADLETAGLGSVFDPNEVDERALANQITALLRDNALRRRAADVAIQLQDHPGYELATDLLSSTFPPHRSALWSVPLAT